MELQYPEGPTFAQMFADLEKRVSDLEQKSEKE